MSSNATSFDLTVLTLFTGNRVFLEPYLTALAALKKPQSAQYLFIDNSNDLLFHEHLKNLTPYAVHFNEQLAPGAADNLSAESQRQKADHCARLYEFSKKYVLGKDLLILEHDVIPKPDALEKLQQSRKFYRADFISASVLSRVTGEWLAWRFRRNFNSIDRVMIGRRPKRVLATGFGFLLTTGELFKKMRITAADGRYPFFGCDIHAGVWAGEEGLRWFLDGGVRCGHLRDDREFARLGDFANVLTGPVFDLQNPELAP